MTATTTSRPARDGARQAPDLDPARGSAGDLVLLALAEQVDELLRRAPEARQDVPDGVHKMRVATRRLRSHLAAFRPLFDRSATDPIRDELAWLGDVLGGARDAEVQREQLEAAARAIDPELRLGPVVERIRFELGREHQEAHARAVEALGSDRYLLLLDRLEDLVDVPPFRGRAARPARRELPRLVRRSTERVRRRADQADDAPAPRRLPALHEVRKAAKRARYAGEAVAAIGGKEGKAAAKVGRRMEDLQELLGQVQDGVTSQAQLRRLGVRAHLAGENGFTFGLLHGRTTQAIDEALERYPKARRRAC